MNTAPNGKVKQHIPKELRYSMRDFYNEFPNDAACLEFVKEQRYPGGITQCKKCGVERKHHRVGNRTAYACQHCGNHIFPLAGTIFHKSATPLRLWFYAMYLMGSTRCGISAKQIQRETGVTYKTAWRMFKQIRSLLANGSDDPKLSGKVEMDETYMGGVRKGHRGRPNRGDKKKIPVVAVVERGGGVYAKVISEVDVYNLSNTLKESVETGVTLYTDELHGYNRVAMLRDSSDRLIAVRHKTVHHSSGEYVRRDAHTNTVEGFWSLLKNGIRGVYHQVSPKYLQTYLDEYTFRYNRRHDGNQQFRAILRRVAERAR